MNDDTVSDSRLAVSRLGEDDRIRSHDLRSEFADRHLDLVLHRGHELFPAVNPGEICSLFVKKSFTELRNLRRRPVSRFIKKILTFVNIIHLLQ